MSPEAVSEIPQAKLLIDGIWKGSSEKSNIYTVLHPQSLEAVCTAVSASSYDVQEAVAAASRAFPLWESTAPSQRREILLKAADLLETPAYIARIKEWTCKETGALDIWGHLNGNGVGRIMREAASLATRIRGETLNSESPEVTFMVQRRAIGVVLAISPWNAPGLLTVRAVAIPLICGNTVILKSSELSPMTISIIAEALHEAGLPKGVLNYLNMSRENAPALTAEIISHPAVRKLNFTGSDRVGKLLAAEAAKYLKPCVFELGGKAPCVVLNDADLEDAAKSIVTGAMLHSGQICMSTERVIVQSQAADKLMQAVAALASTLQPTTSSTTSPGPGKIGPLFSPSHAGGFISLLESAKAEGAEVVMGDLTKNGAVVGPHILKDVKPGMKIWERESFGPVVGFATVETVDEAIELANKSEYSLTASLWSKSIDAVNIAGRIRAGTVIINGNTFNSELSFGNFGLGGATGYGRFDIEHWTDLRAIVIRPGGEKYPFLES